MRTPPNAARALLSPALWVIAALALTLGGAPLSATRLLGAVLLIALPAILIALGDGAARRGLAASGTTLLAAGLLLGAGSGATLGTAVGGTVTWAALALARSHRRSGVRILTTVLAAIGLVLTLAPSVGSAGPRTAGAALALAAGWIVGGRTTMSPTIGSHDSAPRRTAMVARGGIGMLVALAVVRSLVDIDAPAIRLLLALRRVASLVLPTGTGLLDVASPDVSAAGLFVLPWLLPLAGASVALLTSPRRTDRSSRSMTGRSMTGRSDPLPADVTILIAAGLVATAMADLIGVNWPLPGGRIDALLLWPDRHLEVLLWSLLAVAVTVRDGRSRGLRTESAAVAATTGLVLLTVLAAEWRVDGVALRPALLSVPAVFLGLVVLARGGVRQAATVAVGVVLAGIPVLAGGLAAGMLDHGPSRSGARSFIPGDAVLLIEGDRLVGLLLNAVQSGVSATSLALAAALIVALPSSIRLGLPSRMIGWTGLALGLTSVVLAEAKGALGGLGLGVGLAVAVVTLARGGRAWGWVRRWSHRIGVGLGMLVVAAPFVGAAVLDQDALRPEVWRRSLAALTLPEWLIGLGAQPLRVDREFHTRVDSSWGAVQAHNQALEFLLIAGIPGLLLLLALVAVLLSAALRAAHVAHGWAVVVAASIVADGASGPNLTYFGHDLAFVMTAALLVGVASRPRLVRLSDDPASLPAALERVWAAGDAAVVAPAGASLPAPIERALAGGSALPLGTALVVPTSGSTGTPRAVVLPHAALQASTAASISALGCAPGERWALALPLRHVAGLQVLARARALGTPVHVVTDPGDPHAIAAAAAHAEYIALVPTQLVRCLDAGVDLTAFRSVLVGGGPLAPQRAVEARAQGIRLVQSYGMTETCGGCVYDGRPLDGVEIGVDVSIDVNASIEHTGNAAHAEASGRIRLRGPMRATGYLDADPDDAAHFTPDGWFVTDDLGRFAPDGTLEVLGRADAVITTGGVKVDPLAVETLLRADVMLAGVMLDVVVLGVPDAEWGERVRAVVVPTDPAVAPTLDALRASVSATLPTTHAPRELVLTERIARDGLGKVSAAERTRLRRLPGPSAG